MACEKRIAPLNLQNYFFRCLASLETICSSNSRKQLTVAVGSIRTNIMTLNK